MFHERTLLPPPQALVLGPSNLKVPDRLSPAANPQVLSRLGKWNRAAASPNADDSKSA
ncbi:MAG: hypothetical protein ACJAYU_001316 [Bradymonadia bacterium]|jgi:hypothetical protein